MKYDPTGIWFKVFEDLGEPSNILFDFQIKGENQPVKHLYSHSLGDATAAMNEISAKYNFILKKDVEKTTPQKASFTNNLKQIAMFNFHTRPRKSKLWPFDFAKTATIETPYVYFVIEKEALAELKARIKKQKVSLNTHLLHSLDQATRKTLRPVRNDLSWLVPVNLRRELGLPIDAPGNQAANFTCVIENETAEELQNKITGLLKSKRHAGVWFWQNSSKYLPYFLVKLATRYLLHPNYNAGTFTNLGEWSSPTEFSHFTFFANPVQSHPIVASSLEINKKLTLGICLYPTFPLSPKQLQDYLEAWKNNILR